MGCHCCLGRGAKLCVGKVKRKAVSKEMPLKDQIITRKFVKCFANQRFVARLELVKRGTTSFPWFSPIRHQRVGENPANKI